MFETRGGPLRVMPLPFAGWDRRNPWRRAMSLPEFRAGQRAAAGIPTVETPIAPPQGSDLPPGVAEPPEVVEAWLARQDAEIEAYLAGISPAERFELEHGIPATPEQLRVLAPVSQEQAAFRQDLAVQAHRMRTIADAHRIATLLAAHEASIIDLTTRFGGTVGSSEGLGGRAFATSIALLTGTDPNQVTHEVSVGTTLRDRLPLTWAVFQSGAASWSRVQKAVTRFAGLDEAHRAAYDEAAADIVATSTRVKADLRKARERLQDDSAAQRARTTFERRHTTVELGSDSGAAFIAEGLATAWIPINDGIHQAAVAAHGTEGETRTLAQLRHDITLDLLDEGLRRRAAADPGARVPQRKPVDVQLILTVPALGWLGMTTEQAVLGGYGPISMEQAKGLAGQARSFVRVLTDPVTGVRLTMDRRTYRPPADLARWVRIRDGRTRFPGRSTPAHLADIDHAREWDRDHGPTNADNLITLDRPSHNAKSAGLYEHELRDDGVVVLGDAWGHRFEDPPDDPLAPAPSELLPSPAPPDEDPCPF